MALQTNDLFVVQSQTDSKLYSLKLSDLKAEIEGGGGIQFKGSVDLNNSPAAQNPVVTLPATNGDMYIVEANAAVIEAGWVMADGVSVAQENDRIIYDANDANWILVTGGTNTGGTVTDITATIPLKATSDPVNPVITVNQARTTTEATTAADGEGTSGVVDRLAEAADVVHDNGAPDSKAVVTADLLQATNKILQDLTLAPGGVQSVSEGSDAAGLTNALVIPNTSGAVTIQVKKETFCPYDFSSLTDINA